VWKQMLCGSECCVKVNVNGSECYMEQKVVWNRMLCGSKCCVEENVVWKRMLCGSEC